MRYLLLVLAFIAFAFAMMYVDRYSPLNAVLCAGLVFVGLLVFAYSGHFAERWTGRKPARSNRYDATFFLVGIGALVFVDKLIPDSGLFVNGLTFGLCMTAASVIAQCVFGDRVTDTT